MSVTCTGSEKRWSGTRHGEFRLIAYESEVEGGESHVALVRGDIENAAGPVLVRMHSHCVMGDVFGSTACDCRPTIEGSMRAIADAGRGAIIYLHQTSKGFSMDKIGNRPVFSFHRDRALPTLPESERKTQREIGIGAQILSDLNLRRIRFADQPSATGRSPGRVRYRDRRAGSRFLIDGVRAKK